MTLMKTLIVTTATLAMAGGAWAQSTVTTTTEQSGQVQSGEGATVDAATLVELDDDFVVPGFNLPVDVLDDYDVVDRNGEYVGDVEEVVGPDRQTATSIVVEFDGPGWLFDDDVERVVDITLFTIDGERLVLDMTEDAVRSLPVYKDD
ncbi:hypothetical protein L1787_06535 [Acuticoccus sp. M5D2P5]|uniref:hypothetical protein n=1 Tax=Acuticoccus kalidii TaxID=2910977 RepID=UPI001F3F9291|nr:hypothetical protein [Acuticoccus kalidii]MCF3933071.1 hypothetical protein [Acuticoccus kalidii]